MRKLQIKPKPNIETVKLKLGICEIFKKLENVSQNCFLFESLTDGPDSRYAILGFDPEQLIRANGDTLTLNGRERHSDNPYFEMRSLIPQDVISENFAGGLVGYLSYEAAEYFEHDLKLRHNRDFDQFCFGLYTDGLVFDKATGETAYFYHGKNRLPQILKIIRKSAPRKSAPRILPKGVSMSRAEHRQMVLKVKEEISRGNTFQCEVGIRNNYGIVGSPLPIYEELRKINPSPYMYYLKFGDRVLMGASPELLFDLKNGEMQTFPLAGTARRGSTEKSDRELARKLVNDPKERAEHMMLVDLHRNDIGRAARFGTVRVRRLMDIKKFSHVQHLSSEITGSMARGEDMFSALADCFPAGTLSGAPKIESMKIIDRNEEAGRGPYGGGVGYFGFNGNCMFAIPIRSLFVSGSSAYVQTSGGIVYDSKPENEYREIMNKLRAMETALKKFLPR